jgi:hypothetical protein
LDFKWEVFLDGKSIYKIEETGKNELRATLPEPVGTYFFHIMINNPDSNYYLRGGFNLVLE